MSNDVFPDLPDDAHVWIHAANRPLKNDELKALENELINFISSWTSHGEEVQSKFRILERRVLVVAAKLPKGDISGCGIDDLVHRLERISKTLDFEWNGPLDVFYRDKEGLYQQTSRDEFEQQVKRGTIDRDTPVLDVSSSTLGEVRNQGIEQPAHSSWISEVYSFS